jgi:ribose-phosphate pyrophosphokinase
MIRLEDIEAFGYPGGEQQVRLNEQQIDAVKSADNVGLLARIRSSNDLIRLALAVDAISGVNPEGDVTAILPYLPYGRADRRFKNGDCFGLELFGQLLDAAGVFQIVTLDAHSKRSEYILCPSLIEVLPETFIRKAAVDFAFRNTATHINILYPDKGAQERYALPSDFGCNVASVRATYLHAEKQRDPISGKLLGFDVPDLEGRPTLIVDDICDGGGTFLGIAEKVPGATLGLHVTHGIFSKGYDDLLAKFQAIYTTNSFAEIVDTDRITVYDCIPTLLKGVH